jgi:hypothetical protein
MLTPAAVNEFRFGVNSLFNFRIGRTGVCPRRSQRTKDPRASTLRRGAAWGAPSITSITGISAWGGGGDPFEIRNASFQAVEYIQPQPRKAFLPFGGEWRRDRFNTIATSF